MDDWIARLSDREFLQIEKTAFVSESERKDVHETYVDRKGVDTSQTTLWLKGLKQLVLQKFKYVFYTSISCFVMYDGYVPW